MQVHVYVRTGINPTESAHDRNIAQVQCIPFSIISTKFTGYFLCERYVDPTLSLILIRIPCELNNFCIITAENLAPVKHLSPLRWLRLLSVLRQLFCCHDFIVCCYFNCVAFYLRFVVWLYYAIFGQVYHLMHVRRRLLDFVCAIVVMNVSCV